MDLKFAQRLVFGGLLVAGAGFAGGLWLLERELSASVFEGVESGAVLVPNQMDAPELPGDEVWARPGREEVAREVEHYQLAGTFQTYAFQEEGRGEEALRALALVDDLRTGRQRMVREGDRLGVLTVASIGKDRVTVTRKGRKWVLTLPGVLASRSDRPEDVSKPEKPGPKRFEDYPALETSRFGKKIKENQWVLQRQALLDYAGEIMNSPLRATQLYRSFSQTARNEGDEAGFEVVMKGEESFFEDMGLGDGDVIRKVNSMKMKNQRRAEYLVREFMKDRMSAVVLDVERDGETRKQIYIIR